MHVTDVRTDSPCLMRRTFQLRLYYPYFKYSHEIWRKMVALEMYILSKCLSYLSLLSEIDCISQETAHYTESQESANSGTGTAIADEILPEPSFSASYTKSIDTASSYTLLNKVHRVSSTTGRGTSATDLLNKETSQHCMNIICEKFMFKIKTLKVNMKIICHKSMHIQHINLLPWLLVSRREKKYGQ